MKDTSFNHAAHLFFTTEYLACKIYDSEIAPPKCITRSGQKIDGNSAAPFTGEGLHCYTDGNRVSENKTLKKLRVLFL